MAARSSFGRVSKRALWALLIAVLVALVAAAVVGAANPGKEKIALTAAGQRQAKAEVLHRSDVGPGWSGGTKKPKLSSTMPCSGYRPKQSDLVTIGAAETRWHVTGIEIDSEAQVLRTPAMVWRDWRRTVLARPVMPCLRQGIEKSLKPSEKLVSFRRVSFPHVARYTHALRAIIDVTASTGQVVPVEVDLLALGAGRNELTLSITGPKAAEAAQRSAELRFARTLASRLGP